MKREKQNKSTSKVKEGVESLSSIDNKATERFLKQKRKRLSAEDYVKGIISGNRVLLSRAITIVESSLPEDEKLAMQIVNGCLEYSGNSVRIGVSGVPGVGKSTFIEALGKYLTANKHKVAVLAIDPSSEQSKGSILGDKTRMEVLSGDTNAFIRPSPSSGTLGGVARKTSETIVLCEAAGFDVVIVETVGVGQSEIEVHSMVDFFLLLQIAGAGDELQGIKRGIMEMADGIVVNKADGDNVRKAEVTARDIKNAIHMFSPSESLNPVKVLTCSSIEKKGIEDVWEMISGYVGVAKDNGYFFKNRQKQAKHKMHKAIKTQLELYFYNNIHVKRKLSKLEGEVMLGKINPFEAARILFESYEINQ